MNYYFDERGALSKIPKHSTIMREKGERTSNQEHHYLERWQQIVVFIPKFNGNFILVTSYFLSHAIRN